MAIDPGYFRTKYFAISAVVAVALVGGAAATYFVTDAVSFGFSEACDRPRHSGTPIQADPEIVVENRGRDRTIGYDIDASGYAGGVLDLCVGVGEILVENSTTDMLEIEVRIRSHDTRATEKTEVDTEIRSEGDRLMVAVWVSRVGEAGSIFGMESANVILVLKVPNTGPYDVDASASVGDFRLSGLLVRDLDASASVGSAIVREIDLLGNASLVANVGNALLETRSVQTGRIIVESNVGDAEVLLPQRADVGYDAIASSNVGETTIRLGDTEAYTSDRTGAGEHESARSSGFAQKPTQVKVQATANVGDARIVAE